MIIDLQRRLAECGRIRIGQQVATSNGKTRPEKLETFRLTSPDRVRIEAAAQQYGGAPAEWQAPAGKQWEIITQADVLDVIVPPADMAFSQWYELWGGGGCQRRCDGQSETISDGPCVCDPDDRQCDIHTRLSVMLRDLPGLGVWRIDTQGYYAAVELQGAVGIVQMAAGRGQMLPARLRLEQRMVKRPGQPTRRFAVPVLDIEVSPGQLLSATSGDATPLIPVPQSVAEHPAPSIEEQASKPVVKPARANAAQPVARSGLPPRAMAQKITQAQMRKLGVSLKEAGLTERPAVLAFIAEVVGREVGSRKDLTSDEASQVIDILERRNATDATTADEDELPGAEPENADERAAQSELEIF